jgi:hypothetical protein
MLLIFLNETSRFFWFGMLLSENRNLVFSLFAEEETMRNNILPSSAESFFIKEWKNTVDRFLFITKQAGYL